MRNIFIVGAVAIVGFVLVVLAGIGYMTYSLEPVIVEKIVEVEKECEECVVSESVVYRDVVKEVPVDKIVIRDVIQEVEVVKEVEKIVYRDCVKEDIDIESLSVYTNEDSVKFYLNTDVETEAFLRVYPANRGFDYNNGISDRHTLEATDLKKNTEYFYQITLITEDGFVQKSGDFLSSK